ncbi:hypothetical protein ACW7EJ_07890, partial [Acinetobacter soli]
SAAGFNVDSAVCIYLTAFEDFVDGSRSVIVVPACVASNTASTSGLGRQSRRRCGVRSDAGRDDDHTPGTVDEVLEGGKRDANGAVDVECPRLIGVMRRRSSVPPLRSFTSAIADKIKTKKNENSDKN